VEGIQGEGHGSWDEDQGRSSRERGFPRGTDLHTEYQSRSWGERREHSPGSRWADGVAESWATKLREIIAATIVGDKYAKRIEELALSLYKTVCYDDIVLSNSALMIAGRREITLWSVALL